MTGKQHVDFHRKLMLRKNLLAGLDKHGAVYVPFIGDGDIAAELYPNRMLYGADLDPARAELAAKRLGVHARVVAGDCDRWPFTDGMGLREPYTVADFDAYAYP